MGYFMQDNKIRNKTLIYNQQTQQKVATKIIVFSTPDNEMREMHKGMHSK